MKIKQHRIRRHAFSLVEVVVALAIIAVLFLAGLAALYFNKIQTYKDRERGLMLDFAVHYLETVKGMAFGDLAAGAAINPLYDGTAGGANIRIPTNFTWFSVTNTNYTTFHSELSWLLPRNPEMRVNLTTPQSGGVDHTKLVRLELRWDAPLGQGGKIAARMDMARFKDL